MEKNSVALAKRSYNIKVVKRGKIPIPEKTKTKTKTKKKHQKNTLNIRAIYTRKNKMRLT